VPDSGTAPSMSPTPYSFIDVAILDGVRERFAAGDAVVILSADLEELIWANGPGALLFGVADVEAVGGAESGLSYAAKRQIMSTSGYPRIGSDRGVVVRLAKGIESRAYAFLASEITLPDGEEAILLAVPAGLPAGRESEVLENAIGGFAEPGHLAAFIDGKGAIEAASAGFSALGISTQTLADMAEDAVLAGRRLVKKLIASHGASLPAGMARLRDTPARHLLLVVDERVTSQSQETAALAAAPTAAVQAVPQEVAQPAAIHLNVPPLPVLPEPTVAEVSLPSAAPAAAADEGADEAPAPATNLAPTRMLIEDVEVPDEPSPHVDVQASRDEGIAYDGAYGDRPAQADALTQPTAIGTAAAQPVRDIDLVPDADRAASPLRFAWKTDAEGRFTAISPEFVLAVGERAGNVIGRRFNDVSNALGLDPYSEIAGLLERRDTWSGRSVLWPVTGTDLRVPVDLAALPVYGRDRSFEGFRGFGVARMADAVVDPEALGQRIAETSGAVPMKRKTPTVAPISSDDQDFAAGDPFQGEVPALSIVQMPDRRSTDKIIKLAEHRSAAPEKNLSSVERSAFREIGERLRVEDGGARPQSATEAAPDVPLAVEPEAPVETAAPHAEPEANAAPLLAPEASIEAVPVAAASPAGDEITTPIVEDSAGAEPPDAATPEPEPAAIATVALADSPAAVAVPAPAPAIEPATVAIPRQSRPSSAELKIDGFLPSAFSGPAAAPRRPNQDTPILSRLPVPLLVHSGDRLHYANEEFLALTGYESVEQLAQAGGLGALFSERYDDGAQDGDDRAIRLRTRDGLEFAIEALLRSVPWNGGKALMLVVRRTGDEEQEEPGEPEDVPALPAETAPPVDGMPAIDTGALKARVAEMRTIIDTATDGVILIANDGTIRSISRPAEALFGFDSDDLAGKPFVSLFAIESQRAARDYLTGLSDNGVASVLNDGREVIGREAQGRFIPLFMTIGKLPGDSGYCAVVRDITQWKRAEEELTQAKAVAERASSQKTDFLARVSHEIRTPLNAIIGFSELMVDERFGPIANERYRDYLRDINRSGNHVLDLVNDLLDITKIEAGEQEMAYEAVSLNDTLAETVAMMQPQANRERVIIRSSFASRLPEVVADLRSIRQIALNILSNAVRYTQAGGQVIISTSYELSGDVVMRVRDTGIGMSAAEIEQAMKPFKQINSLKRARGDGTGLGLPLTKAMVEANRARFTITSSPGDGTLVEVVFPATRVLAD